MKKDEQIADLKTTNRFSFDFAFIRIFGGFNDKIHVEGTIDYHQPCVLAISIKMYNQMFKLWFNEKVSYCERYEAYVGVFGDIFCHTQ